MAIVKLGRKPYEQPELYFAVGDTFPVKEKLKAIGFTWDDESMVWIREGFIDVSHLGLRLEYCHD